MFIFYHEQDNTSTGAAVVIINLIRGLTNAGKKVALINYINGAIHKSLENVPPNLLKVIDRSTESIKSFACTVSPSDIILTMHYYTVYRFFKKSNPRVIFYCVNITSLPVANKYFGHIHIRSMTKMLILEAEKKNGLLFIDSFSLDVSQQQLKVNIEHPDFLPIPVEVPSHNLFLKRNIKPRERRTFTYVGRAADWKIFPVRKILRDLAGMTDVLPLVDFHIVTDNIQEFKNRIADIHTDPISIWFHEHFTQQKLQEFLLETSDLHFAMGTSSLDGAKLGVPTVLLDFAYNDFPEDYRYHFLFETEGYTVGTHIQPGQHFSGFSMSELYNLINDTARYKQFSEKSYQYISQNHDLLQITEKLIKHEKTCTMHLSDTARYLIRYWR